VKYRIIRIFWRRQAGQVLSACQKRGGRIKALNEPATVKENTPSSLETGNAHPMLEELRQSYIHAKMQRSTKTGFTDKRA
jgi:hypothetical protein